MRVNEEIDAMQTMGLNTVDTLVLPRIIGLVIALPLLTFYADIMGLIGGAVMCYFQLGITIPVFMRQLQRGGERQHLDGGPDQGAGLRLRDRAGRLL